MSETRHKLIYEADATVMRSAQFHSFIDRVASTNE